MALKTKFKLIFYRKDLESISSILRMKHSLVPLKTNFKLIFYGKDLESVSSILRMGHSLVPLNTNFKLILNNYVGFVKGKDTLRPI